MIVVGLLGAIIFMIGIGKSVAAQTVEDALSALRIILIGLAIAISAILLYSGPASSHDREHPELDGWFRGLQSHGKAACCDGSDAVHVADVDWESKNGHYRVRLDGEWIDVSDDAVIDGPNLDGRTLVWPVKGPNGTWIRCFMPGPMG